jgi:hypothetical protein
VISGLGVPGRGDSSTGFRGGLSSSREAAERRTSALKSRPLAADERSVARLLVLLLLAGFAMPASASAAAPSGFVGMVSEDALTGTPAYRAREFDRMRSVGVTLVRQVFDWSIVERRRRHYDFSGYDHFVGDAARRGIQVMPILFNPPRWASSRPRRGALRGAYPPRRGGDLALFAGAAIRRYGPDGTYWADNPSVPRVPIRAWQIWNEPNLKAYWRPRPSARAYARMLKPVARKIHRLDPSAEVVTAGIPQSRIGVPLKRYVRRLLVAGAARSFDTLAVNPYAQTGAGVIGFLRSVRAQLDARGAAGAGLRATELGWSDDGPASPYRLGPDGQAQAIEEAIAAMGAERESLKLRGFVYFNWKDAPPYAGFRDFWGLHTGLHTLSGAPKPALQAFARAAGTL